MAVRAAAVCLFKSTAAPPATYISAAPTSGYRPRRCTLRASRRRTSRSHKLSLTSLSPPPLPTPPAGPAAGPAAALLALVLVTITPPPPAAAATTSRVRESGTRRGAVRRPTPSLPRCCAGRSREWVGGGGSGPRLSGSAVGRCGLAVTQSSCKVSVTAAVAAYASPRPYPLLPPSCTGQRSPPP